MSHAYNAKKKAKRRALDAANPDRTRIRNQIKRGILNRWMVVTKKIVTPIMGMQWDGKSLVESIFGAKSRIEYRLVSVFTLLTEGRPEDVAKKLAG